MMTIGIFINLLQLKDPVAVLLADFIRVVEHGFTYPALPLAITLGADGVAFSVET